MERVKKCCHRSGAMTQPVQDAIETIFGQI